MKFWLILKQSFRSFYSKIGLYLTFTIFLIIALSMIVGLFGFSYGFESSIRDSLGHLRLNQRYDFDSAYVPTWVVNDQGGSEAVAQKLDPSRFYWEQEEDHKISDFLISQFPNAFPSDGDYSDQKLAHPENNNQLQLALLTLGLGYFEGDMWSLQENQLYNNPLLYNYFSTLKVANTNTSDILQTNLDTYNQFIYQNRGTFNKKFFANNVPAAIFLDQFKSNPNQYLLGSPGVTTTAFYSPEYPKPVMRLKYQRLNRNSNLVRYKPDLVESTPWLLFSNEAAPFNIIQELSVRELAKYDNLIQEYRYTYVPPKFLQKNHLHLGDEIKFYYQNDKNLINPINFVIVGTMAETYLFNSGDNPNFTIPYQWAANYQLPNNPSVTLDQYFFPYDVHVRLYNRQFGTDFRVSQKAAAHWFMQYFQALRIGDQPRFYEQLISPDWLDNNNIQSSYDLIIGLFYTLASVLSVLIIILLFVVFYFITREIINMERNTLFYLKAIGVYNSGLSILTTFAMLVPILIGVIGGLFGALVIQLMIFNIALDRTVLVFGFFKFNYSFVLTFLIAVIVILLGFYAINFYFLRSPALVTESSRSPGFLARGLIKTKLKIDRHFSRGVRITLAFAFKNIYKNIVTFCILSVAFALILYIVQFQSSLTTIANAYEKWNQPYKSVLYQPRLSPTIAGVNDYERSYEVISEDQLSSLKPINISNKADNPYEELEAVIKLYLLSLKYPSIKFNWTDYYFTKDFSKKFLEDIGPNPTDEYINLIIDSIANRIGAPKPGYKIRGQIITIVKQIAQQNNTLKNNFGYSDGYNILFGKVLTPQNQPKRDVLTVRTLYPEHQNREIKTLLFENDATSRSHYGFQDSTTANSYIQSGTYSVMREPGKYVNAQNLLRIGISSYLQTNYSIRVGDAVAIRLDGFKTDPTFDGYRDVNSALVYAYVSHVVRGDTIQNTLYSSQIGVLNYLAQGNHEINSPTKQAITDQEQYYGDLLQQVENNQTTLSNTVFTTDNDVPFGIRNITLPFFSRTDPSKPLGSRIEDFYSDNGAPQKYLNSFENNIMVFRLITEALQARTEQFILILWRFVVILTLFALIISLLLVTLVLLENRRIISVLKSLGYRRIEITGYLISGYLFSTILAIIASIGLSFLAFFLTKRPISQYLGMSVYYLFSWQFFLLAIMLGVIFTGLMAISIAIFTRYQNPKNAFISA